MQYKAIFSQQASWALVIGFSVAIAALLFGLWLISPRELAKFVKKAPVMQPPAVMEEQGELPQQELTVQGDITVQ